MAVRSDPFRSSSMETRRTKPKVVAVKIDKNISILLVVADFRRRGSSW